jgi:hypothetical protein
MPWRRTGAGRQEPVAPDPLELLHAYVAARITDDPQLC